MDSNNLDKLHLLIGERLPVLPLDDMGDIRLGHVLLQINRIMEKIRNLRSVDGRALRINVGFLVPRFQEPGYRPNLKYLLFEDTHATGVG